MFSTHYHMLVDDFVGDDRIANYHMSYFLDEVKYVWRLGWLLRMESLTPLSLLLFTRKTVTFLYQLEPGACKNSHGMNVARLAGLPEDIISKAEHKGQDFEEHTKRLRASYQRYLSTTNSFPSFLTAVWLFVCLRAKEFAIVYSRLTQGVTATNDKAAVVATMNDLVKAFRNNQWKSIRHNSVFSNIWVCISYHVRGPKQVENNSSGRLCSRSSTLYCSLFVAIAAQHNSINLLLCWVGFD